MDAQNLKIDVICLCSADGSLSPLRFRYEDEEHTLRSIAITEVVCCKQVQYVGIEAFIYTCKAFDSERERLFDLKYTVRTHQWALFRMLY